MTMLTRLYRTFAAMLLATLAMSSWAREVLIDVRTPQEYAQGHIDGAINIDHTVIAQDIGKAKVGKDDSVVLYCRSGRRSEIALDTLRKMGYTKVQNYGSMEEAAKRLQNKN